MSGTSENLPELDTRYWVRVGQRALLLGGFMLLGLLLRGGNFVATARALDWLQLNGGDICDALPKQCQTMNKVLFLTALLPTAVCACLSLGLFGGGGDSRKLSWAWPVHAIIMLLGFTASLSLWLSFSHSSVSPRWAAFLVLIALITGALRLLWLSDERLGGSRIGEAAAAASDDNSDDNAGVSALTVSQPEPGEGRTTRHPVIPELLGSLSAQRVSVFLMAVYLLLILVLSQTSGQVLDALRVWNLDGADNDTTQTVLGVASTCLLGLGLRESAGALVRAADRPKSDFSGSITILIGAVLIAVGLVLVATTSVRFGIVLLGGFVVVLGLFGSRRSSESGWFGRVRSRTLSRGRRLVRARIALGGEEPVTFRQLFERSDHSVACLHRSAEWLVATPFLVISTALCMVAVDALWVGVSSWRVVEPALFAISLLALGSMISVDHRGLPPIPRLSLRAWIAFTFGPAILIVVPFLTLQLGRPEATLLLSVGAVVIPLAVSTFLVISGRRAAGLTLNCRVAIWTGIAVAAAVHLNPLKTGEVLGVVTLVNVAAAVAIWLGYGVTRLSTAFRPPPLLIWLGLKRLPIGAMIIVWWLACGLILSPNLHQVRIERLTAGQSQALEGHPRPTLSSAFRTWVKAQPELNPGYDGKLKTVPMAIIAAHGGGMRAAFWTARVLDCLVARERTKSADEVCRQAKTRTPEGLQAAARRIFIASGVSGGSVGLAAYAENLYHGDLTDRDWMQRKDVLGGDFASATIGWGLFHDLPNHVLGIEAQKSCQKFAFFSCVTQDRAAVLEASLDARYPDGAFGIRQVWADRYSREAEVKAKAETVPLLMFDSVLAGGRFGVITSAAKLGQQGVKFQRGSHLRPDAVGDELPLSGYQETTDLLCQNEDLWLSTAAILSARFPVISPSGRVTIKSRCARPQQPVTYRPCSNSICGMNIVDGGYLDNSGMLAINGLWPELRRLVIDYNTRHTGPDIAPFVVDVDSAYQARGGQVVDSSGVTEGLTPVRTVIVRSAVEAYARGRIFRALPYGCAMTIAPTVHPGVLAPLGWSLSESTMAELTNALDDPTLTGGGKAGRRLENLPKIQRWLSQNPVGLQRCVPGASETS